MPSFLTKLKTLFSSTTPSSPPRTTPTTTITPPTPLSSTMPDSVQREAALAPAQIPAPALLAAGEVTKARAFDPKDVSVVFVLGGPGAGESDTVISVLPISPTCSDTFWF